MFPKNILAILLALFISGCSITPHHAVFTDDLNYLRKMPSSEVNNGPYGDGDWTPLHVAARDNKVQAIDILISKGANINSFSFSAGVAPIHLAVANNHIEAIDKLIESNVNIDLPNKSGATPLMLSIINGNEKIFKMLLNNKADISIKDINGNTPLMAAVLYNRLNMINTLVKFEADIHTTNSSGHNIITTASANKAVHYQILQRVIQLNSSLDWQTNFGDTALHWAAAHGDEQKLRLLLESGADMNIVNSSNLLAEEVTNDFGVKSVIREYKNKLETENVSGEKEVISTEEEAAEKDDISKKEAAGNKDTRVEIDKKPKLDSTGTSFLINAKGGLITNYHVVRECEQIKVFSNSEFHNATTIHTDKLNDIAYLSSPTLNEKVPVTISSESEYHLGEKLVVLGFPLNGIMGNTIKLTDGSLTAYSGINGDSTNYQISAPIQPGNSGGPVFDEAGNVMGVATSSLSATYLFEISNSIPQNMNFAVKSKILLEFLKANRIPFTSSKSTNLKMNSKEVFINNYNAVAMVLCYK